MAAIVLTIGSMSPRVAEWQRILNKLGFAGVKGKPLLEDGDFGGNTYAATRSWQMANDYTPDGKVTDAQFLKGQSVACPWPFVQAKNYTPAKRTLLTLVVFHTMEAPEKPKTARNVANWFAGANAPQASAHFCVDDQEVVQCVWEKDVAWHAPGANHNGIGVEHAGFASQTLAQWGDDYSKRVLANSAALVARLCHRWGIPAVWLESTDLTAGKCGITGHKQVTDAFNNGKGHWDPGPNFDSAGYIALVQAELVKLQA